MERQLKRGIFPYNTAAHYNTDNFSCGRPELDTFLQTGLARQQNNNMLRAQVILSDDPIPEIMGYYTLSSGSYEKSGMSGTRQRQVPYQNTPCILLGRLAVDRRLQGKGMGAILVAHAAKTAYVAAQAIGVYSLFAEAKDENAGAFYAKLGFIKIATTDSRLMYFYPTNTLSDLASRFPF